MAPPNTAGRIEAHDPIEHQEASDPVRCYHPPDDPGVVPWVAVFSTSATTNKILSFIKSVSFRPVGEMTLVLHHTCIDG